MKRPLVICSLLSFSATFNPGRFNDNYTIRTTTPDGCYHIVSVPYFCSDGTEGCLKVLDATTQKILREFHLTRMIGCVYVSVRNPDVLLKIPTGIGLPPPWNWDDAKNAPDTYVKLYQDDRAVDSVVIPAVLPVADSRRYFYTGRQFDRSKLLYRKPDTLAVVTHKGVALLYLQNGRLQTKLSPGYARLSDFPLLPLDAQVECYPYPQPGSCESVPYLVPPLTKPRVVYPDFYKRRRFPW
ncbi:hypothetical protein [Hymenobacter metallilatus]|uniref:Uncharacterized protein n=1 Tax=Hymenobacter metallilatus TaxID=2493666 RepID=A0A3R9P8Q9_9BACT|nr:hypothetical protein [Hymenobacter metallilatus]RSK31138.1 hypothetical protein EI290_14045 [Hymenobacter metallilatus]